MTDDGDYTEGDAFKAAFEIGHRLADAAFRQRLKEAGRGDGTTIFPAGADTTIGDLLARIKGPRSTQRPGALTDFIIAVRDDEHPYGFRLWRQV